MENLAVNPNDGGDEMLAQADGFAAKRQDGTFRSAEFIRPLLAHLNKRLRWNGFRRSGSTFRREPEHGLLHAVGVQSGRHYPSGPSLTYGQLTVNLQVDLEEVYKLHDVPVASRKRVFGPGGGSVISARLGQLVHGRDVWWPMQGDPVETANTVLEDLTSHGLPFLARFESRALLLAELQRGEADVFARPVPILIASILWGKGMGAEAREVLFRYLRRRSLTSSHGARVEELANRVVAQQPTS